MEFNGVHFEMENKIVRITNDRRLTQYMGQWGHGTRKLVEHIQSEYFKKYKKNLKISADSLVVEILGHVYVDIVAKAVKDLPVPQSVKDYCDKKLISTKIIDCGESDVDENRYIWDILSPYCKVIEALVID